MPGERAKVQEVRSACQECLLRPCGLDRQMLVAQAQAPQGGQEHAGVQLRWPLSEALPVDHARAVAQVKEMAGVKRAVHEARVTLPRPRKGQLPDRACGG